MNQWSKKIILFFMSQYCLLVLYRNCNGAWLCERSSKIFFFLIWNQTVNLAWLEIISIIVNVHTAYVLWYVHKQKSNFKLNWKLGFHVGFDPGQVMGKISENWLDFPYIFWSTFAHSKVEHSFQLLASIFGHTHKLAKKNWTAFCEEKWCKFLVHSWINVTDVLDVNGTTSMPKSVSVKL